MMDRSRGEPDHLALVGLAASVVDSFRLIAGRRSPVEAEAEIGNATWLVVRGDNEQVVALLARSDIEAGRAAGASTLIGDPAMRVPPTAVVNVSATLDDIVNSAIIEILDSAHGLVVVQDDA